MYINEGKKDLPGANIHVNLNPSGSGIRPLNGSLQCVMLNTEAVAYRGVCVCVCVNICARS
jgi:hypothetical protein